MKCVPGNMEEMRQAQTEASEKLREAQESEAAHKPAEKPADVKNAPKPTKAA